jgi:hypothetical protein
MKAVLVPPARAMFLRKVMALVVFISAENPTA